MKRRDFLRTSALTSAGLLMGKSSRMFELQSTGQRPVQATDVTVLNPLDRVPVSLIIDDSTCLVNLAHFCIPQFAEVFPARYKQPWRKLPREIPDAFVRKFGEWCHEHGVKGKYSVVPYPACVGWVDREMPGWTRAELVDSLRLVRELMMPDWDIHPEMVSHTWAINTRTGRPYEGRTIDFMENWGFSVGKSTDELTDYLSYALNILKNADLLCEGITTPGRFGEKVLPELARATLESCRHVFQTEIPHYFKHMFTDERSVSPRVEYACGLEGDDPRCVVSIIGCTGDWFGGWDGLTPGSADRLITRDLQGGRLPEVIARKEPAVMVCHWPGIYYNGDVIGFNIFKTVVRRLQEGYDNLVWMKLSEISRYWAAKELTAISSGADSVNLEAPFTCPGFTVQTGAQKEIKPMLFAGGQTSPLRRIENRRRLGPGTWYASGREQVFCFDLPRGESRIQLV